MPDNYKDISDKARDWSAEKRQQKDKARDLEELKDWMADEIYNPAENIAKQVKMAIGADDMRSQDYQTGVDTLFSVIDMGISAAIFYGGGGPSGAAIYRAGKALFSGNVGGIAQLAEGIMMCKGDGPTLGPVQVSDTSGNTFLVDGNPTKDTFDNLDSHDQARHVLTADGGKVLNAVDSIVGTLKVNPQSYGGNLGGVGAGPGNIIVKAYKNFIKKRKELYGDYLFFQNAVASAACPDVYNPIHKYFYWAETLHPVYFRLGEYHTVKRDMKDEARLKLEILKETIKKKVDEKKDRLDKLFIRLPNKRYLTDKGMESAFKRTLKISPYLSRVKKEECRIVYHSTTDYSHIKEDRNWYHNIRIMRLRLHKAGFIRDTRVHVGSGGVFKSDVSGHATGKGKIDLIDNTRCGGKHLKSYVRALLQRRNLLGLTRAGGVTRDNPYINDPLKGDITASGSYNRLKKNKIEDITKHKWGGAKKLISTAGRSFLSKFSASWGVSDNGYHRKKYFVAHFICSKMFELHTGCTMPFLMQASKEMKTRFAYAVADIINLSTFIPAYNHHIVNDGNRENLLICALCDTPGVLEMLTLKLNEGGYKRGKGINDKNTTWAKCKEAVNEMDRQLYTQLLYLRKTARKNTGILYGKDADYSSPGQWQKSIKKVFNASNSIIDTVESRVNDSLIYQKAIENKKAEKKGDSSTEKKSLSINKRKVKSYIGKKVNDINELSDLEKSLINTIDLIKLQTKTKKSNTQEILVSIVDTLRELYISKQDKIR